MIAAARRRNEAGIDDAVSAQERRGFASFHSLQTGRPTSMARKRKPLVFSGESVELDARGLGIRQRNNGACDLYWIASAEARKRGYLPRTVRLYFDLKDLKSRQDLEQRCKLLTSEMLAWVGDPEGQKKPVYDGTVAALIRCYQTDENSPYRGLAQNTQRGYDDWRRTLERAIGKRRVDRLTGQDLRDCFLAILQPATAIGVPRVRLAKACVRSMLSILLSYGAELGLPGRLELSQVLERMTLRVPKDVHRAWVSARPTKTAMTYEHAAAIIAEGLQRGTRRDRSLALGVAAQFEFTLRQIDVIGEWQKANRAVALGPGMHEPWSGVASRSEVRRLRCRNARCDDVEDARKSNVRRHGLSAIPKGRCRCTGWRATWPSSCRRERLAGASALLPRPVQGRRRRGRRAPRSLEYVCSPWSCNRGARIGRRPR
jgi:hypothetical protein